ncbi:MAG TPA: hypothetical protein VH593_08630 [Ktedonobacteraceae bacterium]
MTDTKLLLDALATKLTLRQKYIVSGAFYDAASKEFNRGWAYLNQPDDPTMPATHSNVEAYDYHIARWKELSDAAQYIDKFIDLDETHKSHQER